MRTLDPIRWEAVLTAARQWTDAGTIPAITLATGTRDRLAAVTSLGSRCVGMASPLPERPIYLVASITKPIVAMAALRLVEQGELLLSQRVSEFLPGFGQHGKYAVEVRHLLTHTSGLPDMLPNNRDLRSRHASLSTFVAETAQHTPAFPAGRGFQYQSMGYGVLGAIIEHVTGTPLRAWLQREFFEPLGMVDTALGAPDEWFAPSGARERIPEIRLPTEQSGTDWHWNSRYWQQMGAPWGGLLTTAEDLSRFSQVMLRGGRSDDGRVVFSPALVSACTRNQLDQFRELPEPDRRGKPWGYGWKLVWPSNSANYGDLCSPQTYGHWGSTGTVWWMDPTAGLFVILLSTQPQDPHGSWLGRLSNQIAAAWV